MSAAHFKLEHEIIVLDAYLKEPLDASKKESWTRNFVDSLLSALRMEELGPLQIYPALDLRAPGWSFIQPITTSHVSGHYFEKPGKKPHIHLDLYSCCAINWQKVIKVCQEHLNMDIWRATFIDRQIDEGERNAMHISGEGGTILDELNLLDHDKHLVAAKMFAEKAKEGMVSNSDRVVV